MVQKIVFAIKGMNCDHCARTVERAAKDAGASFANADHASGQLHVGGEKIDSTRIIASVAEAGYEASVITLNISDACSCAE